MRNLGGPQISGAGRVAGPQANDSRRDESGVERGACPGVDHLDPAQGEEFSKLGLEDDRHRGAIAKALGDAGR